MSHNLITITDSVQGDTAILSFVKPYKKRLDEALDAPLAFAPYAISKTDGKLNSTAGNLMADLLIEMANPIFKSRTGKDLDMAVMNHGGIRSGISKGPVSARTAYKVMPFENNISVVAMTGEGIQKMAAFIGASGRAHPISGLVIRLDANGKVSTLVYKGRPIEAERIYYVATSDYLVAGGDNMLFFQEGDTVIPLDYKIRNAMIDYFKQTDTLRPVVDNRIVKEP